MKVLVLMSGGLDSAVCAAAAVAGGHDVIGLFFDWMQPARREERQAATAQAERLGIRLHTMRSYVHADKSMHAAPGETGPRVVPGRNLVFLALAANLGAERGVHQIRIGCTAADAADYRDCRADFIEALSALSPVPISAPLVAMQRDEVRRVAVALGVDLSEVWSCYAPRERGVPCGACNSCLQ
jgi:7-cyano-7-deazaguanine synthase